ncbi:MAG: DUF4363 family protein [Clostridia bacterium]|nr:DUF4363 family protein [Clostridia bacterium]
MKGFIISVCIMVFILVLVIINSIYVTNITCELVEKIESLDSSYETYNALLNLWDKNSFAIQLSSSTKETDKIEDMISAIGSLYKTGDFSGFEEKKSLLVNYIRLIKSHEKISLENII